MIPDTQTPPRKPYRIFVHSVLLTPQEADKFVELFQSTWDKIKSSPTGPEDTEKLRKYWMDHGTGEGIIALLDDWGRREKRKTTDETLGQALLNGNFLAFWAPTFQIMLRTEDGEEAAGSLIAHELSHSFQFAINYFDLCKKLTDEEKAKVEADAEEHSRAVEIAWDFDPEVRENWKRNNQMEIQRLLYSARFG